MVKSYIRIYGASAEKQDEPRFCDISKKTSNEIMKLVRQLKVNTIVLHPFAHLFAKLSTPEIAVETFKLAENELIQRGFKVIRTPFGWFNTLEIKAKGHPLSRVARKIEL